MLTIEKAVEIYQIHRIENNDRIFLNRSVTENQEHLDFVRSHKTEIVDYLKEHEESMKREAEEQQAKISIFTKGLRFRQTKHNISYSRYDKIVYVR